MISIRDLLKNFNPKEHLMEIESGSGDKKKKNDYLPVQWRIVWFRAGCSKGTIETTMLHLDLETEFEGEKWVWDNALRRNVKVPCQAKGIVVFHAIVTDGEGGRAEGTKSEKAVDFPDFIEKAETGAIGRALAALGYGTQFTGDEWDEAHRIVDSPVDNGKPVPAQQKDDTQKKQPQAMGDYPASEQQRKSIINLCEALGKPSPLSPQTTFEQAKALIQQLTTEQKEVRQQKSVPVNNSQEITAASLRTRIAEIKPRMKDEVTLFTLETLYTAIMHRPYPGDNFPVGERVRINRQLDGIERLRKPVEQPATA